MGNLSAGQIYAAELAAGFDPQAALTGTEIAFAESGGNPAALGDVSLETSTWGPSYGLWQIRTLKAKTGTGDTRDITALSGSVAAQAAAEYEISNGGRNWSPWTTFRTGAYTRYAAQAQAGAAAAPADAPIALHAGGDGTGPFPTLGPSWLPWNLPSDIGNAAASGVTGALGGVRQIALEAGAAVLGLVLVAAGLYTAARPKIQAKKQEAERVAGALL